MIDDLSQQLDSLAATVDGSVDLTALHRSISRRNRGRAAARIGLAASGLFVVVGGLVAIRDVRSSPTAISVTTADQSAISPTSAAASLPDCSTLLTRQRAGTKIATTVAPGSGAGIDATAGSFKGNVSVLAIDGSTITVAGDDTATGSSGTHTVIVDAATEWRNGSEAVVAPSPLQIGQKISIVAEALGDGASHALVVDIGDAASASTPVIHFKGTVSIVAVDGTTLTVSVADSTSGSGGVRPVIVDAATQWRSGSTTLTSPAQLHAGDTVLLATVVGGDGADHALAVDLVVPANSTTAAQAAPGETAGVEAKRGESVVLSGSSLAPGPNRKANGTITAATDTSITIALHGDDEGKTAIADIATTTFYVDATVCRPSALTTGAPVGVAFHLDATSAVVADAILLTP